MNRFVRYQSNLMYLVVCIILVLGSFIMTSLGADENIMEASYQYVFMLIPVVVYILLTNQSFKEVLSLKKVSLKKMLIALLIAIAAQPFISLVAIGMQMLFPSYSMMYVQGESGGLIWSLFLIAVTPAICEEVFMRGVVLHGHKDLPVWKAAIMNGVLFGLFHNNFEQMFYAAAFGAILAFVVLYTDSIYPAMLMHFVMNGLSVVGEHCPDNFAIRLMSMYESNTVLLILLGLASLAVVIVLIRLLKKQGKNKEIETEEAAVKQQEISSELSSEIVYPEWPLILAASISIAFAMVS